MPKFLTNIDLAKNELQNARIQNLATNPVNPLEGQIFYHSTDKTFYGWNSLAWIDLGQSLTGDSIIALLNSSNSIIDDNNLSTNVNDAITKKHSHSNIAIIDATTASFLAAEKTKLTGIATGAEVNQNTFSTIKVGTTDIVADVKTDTLELIAGTGITLTPNTTNDSVTITGVNQYTHPANHPATMITGLSTVATSGNYTDLTSKPTLGTVADKNTGTTSGQIPILDGNGKLSTSIIPAIAIVDTYVVATQAAMLAITTAEVGDIAIRTDLKKTFILQTAGYSVLANWQELLTPTDVVQSVAGKTGVVTLVSSDVGLGNVTNESKATMFTNPSLTGTPTAPTAAIATNTTQIATTAFVKAQAYLRKYAANIGNAVATEFTIAHNLNSKDITINIEEIATGEIVLVDILKVDVNNIKVLFATAPTSNQFRATITG